MSAQPPDNMSKPIPDINFQNIEVKYLKEALASVTQPSTKEEVLLRYLKKCDFDTTLEPRSINKFGDNDHWNLVHLGQHRNGAKKQAKQFF